MFDTIQFNLKYKDVNQLNILKTITRDHSFEETRTCNGVVFTTRLENLTVRSTETTLSIGNGSLCKFLYGDNVVNFTRDDTFHAIEKLSDLLHVSLNHATVSRMDIAYNFEVKNSPESYFYYLGSLPRYKRLEQTHHSLEGLYYNCLSDKKQLVFYDKIKESSYRKDRIPEGYLDRYLLRYELRLKNHVNRMFGVDKITVPMLYDVQFYRRIVDFWKGEYRKIVKVNEYEIDINGCKGIRDLNKMGMLMLVERYGGMNEFFKTFDHQFELGLLDKRQLSEIKRQTKQLLENRSLEIIRNPQIEELNSLIEHVG